MRKVRFPLNSKSKIYDSNTFEVSRNVPYHVYTDSYIEVDIDNENDVKSAIEAGIKKEDIEKFI